MDRIKYTEQGFSYVEITTLECLKWGGMCICNGCGKISDNLKLIYVLGDVYCPKCFESWLERSKNMNKEDIEHDLYYQKDNDIRWYKCHIDLNK